MESFQVGDVVDGKYQLLREVARGGGGVVFEAEHVFTTRRVAVKVLLDQQDEASAAAVRLLREARALSVARNSNVVEILDAGRAKPGGAYLVMELLDGRTVEGLLASRGKFSAPEVAWLGQQIASGASMIHHHGLVHRDLKPSNVFIKYNHEGNEVVTLLDFGAATHEALETNQRITRDEALVGTPEYMSPEQLMGVQQPDAQMDVYSIGVLLYECLLGSVPYMGTYGEILLAVHTGAERLRAAEEDQLAPEMRAIVQRATALDPKNRYDSALELAAALERLVPADFAKSVSLLGLQPGAGANDQVISRRRHTRAPYATPIVIFLKDGSTVPAKTEDISTGGVLALAQGECDSEQIVEIQLTLPSGGPPLQTQVVGRWGKSGRKGTVLGIEFSCLDEQSSEHIHTYVSRTLARQALQLRPESGTMRVSKSQTSEVG